MTGVALVFMSNTSFAQNYTTTYHPAQQVDNCNVGQGIEYGVKAGLAVRALTHLIGVKTDTSQDLAKLGAGASGVISYNDCQKQKANQRYYGQNQHLPIEYVSGTGVIIERTYTRSYGNDGLSVDDARINGRYIGGVPRSKRVLNKRNQAVPN